MLGGEGGGRVETHDGGAEQVVGPSSSGATSMMAGIGEEEKGAGGSDGGGGVEFFEGERSGGGGNRWPRQETLALLKIRSEMDVVFRDSSLKGPLWEQVSRKMAELGYHRGAKKCKEKFENVYKYHKRTKDGRVGKSDGKTYRFFDQLEALEHHHASSASASQPPLPPPPRAHEDAVPVTMVMPAGSTITVPSNSHPITVIHAPVVHQRVNPTHQIQQPQPQQQQQQTMSVQSGPVQMEQPVPLSPSATQSSSSSTSSDEEVMGGRKRKRKWKDYFERLMREVIDKQEELQKRFLEAVEKREHDRAAREEAWKMQEIARLNREHEILVQERSMAAAKDAALISFLQKLSEQQQISLPLPVQIQTQIQTQSLVTTPVVTTTNTSQSQSQPQPQPKTPVPVSLPQMAQPLAQVPPTQPPPPPPPQQAMVATTTNVDRHKANSGDDQNPLTPVAGASSSRWPKAEVETLINLRTSLDQKYQDSGPKGPLWEEISEGMKKLGYNRNAKRCKEKWENINKYFKKVKESSKKRPEDSKTCPYFHQLDALYREKNKGETATTTSTSASYQPTANANMASVGPIPAHPEQQWPAQLGDPESEDDDDDDDDDDDQGNGRFEIVPNNAAASSVNTTTTTTRAATE